MKISEAAKILGISTYSLRNWEKAKRVKEVSRTWSNHRNYTLKDIQRIKKLMLEGDK